MKPSACSGRGPSHLLPLVFALGILLVGAAVSASPARADDEPAASGADPAADAEAAKQRQAAERFLVVLEKNPRRGTALDRLYGYHVEAGSLGAFVKGFQDRTDKNKKDGTAWMILGLLEAQRGRDALAVEAFREAEKQLPENALASYYLGQSLVLVGQPEEAAVAFERAIERKPQRADLLDVFQALGRVYQRAQKQDQALAVWGRLEKLFPDDLRVQEQIAGTLVEEGQHEQALPRYEALAKQVKDEYRAATYRIEAAEIKVRLGKSKDALADFETLLAKLNPENWLYRDVRRRIDEVFLRNDDQAGLAAYYETWIEKNGEDVEAMARLARILAALGRTPEAQNWLDKALERAPSRKDLRMALIDQLVADRKFSAAAAQYEILTKNDPNNPDYLREWGRLILKDATRPEPERKTAAAAVWRKLLDARPKDSLTATQVADLFRQAEMPDDALALYKKAVELSPDSTQYREYLGEYYHTLKRKDEALATWREIAAGKKHTAENVARLAEVLAGFGYLDEAVENIREACKLDDDELKYPLKAAEFLAKAEKYDEALAQLDAAEKLIDSPEDAEVILQQRIRNLQLADKLEGVIEALKTELAAAKEPKAAKWFVLARYHEAARQLPEAADAIGKALALEDRSVPYQTAMARIQESSGRLQDAADTYRKLATIDRRFRTEHLTNVAKLETQLGRVEQALQAGRDLLAAAPGNPEHYEFFAQLCFQLGKAEEGLDALRRSVRLNPAEPKAMLTLAAALAEQFRTDEAIELYWRAFDKAPDLEGRLGVVPRLAELYLQTNHFDRLVERFERERREQGKEREMTICLAQAYHSAGDYGTARQELERLLSQDSRDTQLLQQLSNLSENEGDLAGAIKYQQQMNAVAPGKEGETRLAQLLLRSGDIEESAQLWMRLTMDETDPAKLLTSIDGLLAHDKRDTALTILEKLLRDQPQNWELLYREGAALASNKPEEAERRFKALLALHLPDDEQGVQGKARQKQMQSRPQPAMTRVGYQRGTVPAYERVQYSYEIRRAVGFDGNDSYYYSGQRVYIWNPNDFGQARMAATAWLMRLSEKAGKQEEFLRAARPALDKIDPDARELWDWYYLQSVRQDAKEMYDAAKRLARSGEANGQLAFLTALPGRAGSMANRRVVSSNQPAADTTPPLPAEELELMLECFQSLKQKRPEIMASLGSTLAVQVSTELKRAQRNDEETEIYRSLIAAGDRPEGRWTALQAASNRGDLDTVLSIFDKLADEQIASSSRRPGGYYGNATNAVYMLSEIVAKRADEGAHADALRMIERYLAFAQRSKDAAAARAGGRRRAGAAVYGSSAYYSGSQYVSVRVGRQSRGIRIDYPAPNEYYDMGAISLLRQTYEIYKKDDLLSDLFAFFETQAGKSPPAGKLWWQLGLTYLHWWNEEPEPAVAALSAAVELAPADENLRFELATLHERRQDVEAALKVIEEITPLDHQVMQQRETFALRLAVRTGDVERARQAAERLFGLRLDAETQVQLAAEMRPLGMHEHAEAVLGRARRQAGNRIGALVGLMMQYQAEQKPDLAVQVAHQILRRGGPSMPQSMYRGQTENDAARQQALQVLGRSGKIGDLIERTQKQLAAAPQSIALYQTLVEYYQAAGDRAKSLEILTKQAEIRPDDAKLRYQIAQQLAQSGKIDQALEHYKFALKKEPGLFGNYYYEIQQAFRQANKNDELAALLDDIDLKAVGQYWSVRNIIQELMDNEKSQAVGLKLFKRAWEAFPENRAYILGSLYRDEVWRNPEIYDYARKAVIPGENSALNDPWAGINQVMSYSGDGKVNGMVTRLIDGAVRQNRLPELKTDVEQALTKYPAWSAGKALLAVLHTRMGKPELAVPLVEALLADKQNPVPVQTCWIIGQELEAFDATRASAIALYESTIGQPDSISEFSYSPMKRLVLMYQKAGATAKARELVLKLARPNESDNYDPGYAAYRRMESVSSIGSQLVEMGYPVDAVRVLAEVFGNDELMQQAQRFGGGDYYERRARESYTKALAAISTQSLSSTLATMLDARSEADRKPGEPAVDLVLLLNPRELYRAELNSALATALGAQPGDAARGREIDERIADLVKGFPDDLAVQVLAGVQAFRGGAPQPIGAALSRLTALVERVPLEALPPGGRANSRQRMEAARHIGLWLVARECLKSADHRAVGEKLGARALDAARRQVDRTMALGILREWGQITLDRGDRKGAEARWNEMLELVLPAPVPAKPAASAPAAPRAAPARAGARATFRLPLRGRVGVGGARLGAVGRGTRRSRVSFSLPPSWGEGWGGGGERHGGLVTHFRTRATPAHPDANNTTSHNHDSKPGVPRPLVPPTPGPTPTRGEGDLRAASPHTRVDPNPEANWNDDRTPSLARRASVVLAQVDTNASTPPGKAKRAPRVNAPMESRAAPAKGPLVMPTTLTQFTQAVEISRLAAEHGMFELSLRAVRQSLAGGPPVRTQAAAQGFGTAAARSRIRSNPGDPQDDQAPIFQQVSEKLTELITHWNNAKIPADAQYSVLAELVLPESRPSEIFLYPNPLNPSELARPRSVGRLLAAGAVKAGKVEDLKQRIAARSGQSLAAAAGQVLLAQLAIETGDEGASRAALDALQKHLEADSLQNTAELACHAALPVLDRDKLTDAALPIVELGADRIAGAQQRRGNDEPAASLFMRAARARMRQNNPEAARKLFQKYLDVCQQMNVRYSGDYGSHRRKEQVQQVAAEYARGGLANDALDFLGQYADMPQFRYGEGDIGTTLSFVAHALVRLPALDRYEQLKAWTLPTPNRQAVRLMATFAAADDAPAAFQTLSVWNRPAPRPPGGSDEDSAKPAPRDPVFPEQLTPTAPAISNFDLLIAAAREAGRLDELAAELQEPAAKNLTNAASLAVLVALARGETGVVLPQAQKRLADYPSRFANPNDRPPIDWQDYLIARACVQRPELRVVGEQYLRTLIDHSKRGYGTNWLGNLHYDLASSTADRVPSAALEPGQDPALALWSAASQATARRRAGSTGKSWWVVHEGHVAHVCGPENQSLLFNYPLTGNFDFSVDVPMISWDEGDVSYGGLVFEPIHGGAPTQIYPIGSHEVLQRPDPVERNQFNRITLQVRSDRIRCLVNGHLAYETTDPPLTSPWLALYTPFFRQTMFRNPSLTGKVQIPREVRLTHADRLEGWVAAFFYESLPPRLTIGEKVRYNNEQTVTRDPNPDAYSWSAADGVISGRRLPAGPATGANSQSRLYYHRPLHAGDSIRYEFLYEPGAVEVHPAIGRLTFLLDPAGVRLHWMTEAAEIDSQSGIPADNVVDDASIRRGPQPLPLKPGEWNAVRISLPGDEAVIELNGAEICRRPLEPENDRLFGFYHDALKSAVKVRNVVLTGDWPEKLSADELANLFETKEGPLTPPTVRARHAIVDEGYLVTNWRAMQEQSRRLPAAQRYALLRSWVLPGADHPTFRLYGGYTQANPPAVEVAMADGNTAPPRRLVTGGEPTAPVFDLIAVARELGKLDELAAHAMQAHLETEFDQRSKFAFLTLVALARNDADAAAGYLRQLAPLAEKIAHEAPEFQRWPELVATSQALAVPALRPQSLAILEKAVEKIQQKYLTTEWEHRIRPLRDRARYLSLPDAGGAPYEGDLSAKQWARVTHGNVRTHGLGYPNPCWRIAGGEARHFAGHEHDYLYFAVPLRGNFEVNCQLTTFGWREAAFSYAGTWVGVRYTRTGYELSHYGRNEADGLINPQLPDLGDWYDYRLVIGDGNYTAYINGIKIHEQRVSGDADPWLAVHSIGPFGGGIRNVRITGSPTVPESIDLTSLPDLTVWLSDYYGESVAGENADWKKEGEAIVGRRRTDLPAGCHRHSLLRYHRPMLEDGSIDYEFYYEPGKTLAHPALDRLTFLLDPAGIRLHWLIDGAYETTGLAPDNATDAGPARRGPKTLPLKERDWNRMQASLKGDVVTLTLNGTVVLERPLEPTNQRTFGLFHFAEQTDVRVRNVVYRGNWPRTLPAVAEQELAGNAK